MVLIVTGKNVRYAAITATAPQSWKRSGSFGFSQTTTIGATTRMGTVCEATTQGRKPRWRMRKCASRTPSAKPSTAPSAKPTAASFAVNAAASSRIVISRGPTSPGRACSNSAAKILCRLGIDVSSTRKGHVQRSRIHSQRYPSHRPQRAASTSTNSVARPIPRRTATPRAREWLRGKVSETGAEEAVDPAGNQWFTLRGGSERAVLIGGHIDSVPNGGWLDGALNMMAGVEVLRRIAGDGPPPVTVRLVNWADEEGARFSRSLFGSSAAAGSMADQEELRERRDANGEALPEVLAAHGVDLDRALDARRQLENAAAYLELHIEQGPVLESMGLPLGVVLGTFGVERHQVTFRGQAAHAGSTPMDKRRDALAGAAKLALEIRTIARATGDGAVCTSGGVICK